MAIPAFGRTALVAAEQQQRRRPRSPFYGVEGAQADFGPASLPNAPPAQPRTLAAIMRDSSLYNPAAPPDAAPPTARSADSWRSPVGGAAAPPAAAAPQRSEPQKKFGIFRAWNPLFWADLKRRNLEQSALRRAQLERGVMPSGVDPNWASVLDYERKLREEERRRKTIAWKLDLAKTWGIDLRRYPWRNQQRWLESEEFDPALLGVPEPLPKPELITIGSRQFVRDPLDPKDLRELARQPPQPGESGFEVKDSTGMRWIRTARGWQPHPAETERLKSGRRGEQEEKKALVRYGDDMRRYQHDKVAYERKKHDLWNTTNQAVTLARKELRDLDDQISRIQQKGVSLPKDRDALDDLRMKKQRLLSKVDAAEQRLEEIRNDMVPFAPPMPPRWRGEQDDVDLGGEEDYGADEDLEVPVGPRAEAAAPAGGAGSEYQFGAAPYNTEMDLVNWAVKRKAIDRWDNQRIGEGLEQLLRSMGLNEGLQEMVDYLMALGNLTD